MQSKSDHMSPREKYTQPNKCTIQRKNLVRQMNNRCLKDTQQRKLRPRNKNGMNYAANLSQPRRLTNGNGYKNKKYKSATKYHGLKDNIVLK